MQGWYLEDFEVGRCLEAPERTVTEADVMAFAGLSGDYNLLHTSRPYAERTEFGEPIAHGLLGLAMVSGMMHQAGIINGTIVAFLGLEWRFTGPVRFGDTIATVMRVEEVRPTSRPGRGVVKLAFAVTNQRGEPVQEGVFSLLMRARPAN